jgi:hypothetical protein
MLLANQLRCSNLSGSLCILVTNVSAIFAWPTKLSQYSSYLTSVQTSCLGCVSTCATTQLEACQYARRRSNDQTETWTSSRKEANTRTYLPVWKRETCVTLPLPLAHPFCACLSSCILLPLRMCHIACVVAQVKTQPYSIKLICGRPFRYHCMDHIQTDPFKKECYLGHWLHRLHFQLIMAAISGRAPPPWNVFGLTPPTLKADL